MNIRLILFVCVVLVIFISCKESDIVVVNEELENITIYKVDTTYTSVPDLSYNLESFDQEKLSQAVEGLRDKEFKKGMILWSPVMGSLIQEKILTFGYPATTPCWTVAQWASKYSLKDAKLEILPNGDRVYANSAKTLASNPDGSFKLELKGKQEWGDHVKEPGESWPHIILAQPIYPEVTIPIAKCENIYFSLDGIREYCYNYMSEDVDLRKHTAHTVVNFIIQNRHRGTPTFGKYYIIQFPCYDYRYDFPKKINAYDEGGKEHFTGMLMYGLSGDKLWDGTFKDGKWHKARKDILPIILEAWPIATQPDTPLEGANINDFYLASVNLGWEVTGIFDASMRFKNYSIKAVVNP